MSEKTKQAIEQESQVSPQTAYFIMAMAFAVLSWNGMHNGIYFWNKFNDGTWLGLMAAFFTGVIIGPLLAYIEIPVSILFTNAIRLKDSILAAAFWVLILLAAASFSTFTGIASQNSLDEMRDHETQAHSEKIDSYNDQLAQAQSKRDTAYSLAATKEDPNRQQMIRHAADAKYYERVAEIKGSRAEAKAHAPLQQSHGISDFWFNALMAAFLSAAGIALTIFAQMHIRATVRNAPISFKAMKDLLWNTSRIEAQEVELATTPSSGNVRQSNNKPTQEQVNQVQQKHHEELPIQKASPAPSTAPVNTSNMSLSDRLKVVKEIRSEMKERGYQFKGHQVIPPSDITPEQHEKDMVKLNSAIDGNDVSVPDHSQVSPTSFPHRSQKTVIKQQGNDVGTIRERSGNDKGTINRAINDEGTIGNDSEANFSEVVKADTVGAKKEALKNVARTLASNTTNHDKKFAKADVKGLKGETVTQVFQELVSEGVLKEGRPYRIQAMRAAA